MSKKHKIPIIVENVWDSGIKTAKFCGRCDKQDFIIKLLPAVHRRIQALNDKLDSFNIEWLGYLLGERRDNSCLIDDIVIPEQTVSGASVEVVEKYSNERLIGTIHLHPFANGTFFSTIDEKYIGENHDIMLVTTPSGQYKGSATQELDCGARMQVDAKVEIDEPLDSSLDEFINNAFNKIKIKKYEYEGEYANNEPKTNYYENIHYCGRCRKRMDKEVRIVSDGVEICLPCYDAKDKTPNTLPEQGMICCECKKHTPWTKLVWEQGDARCTDCHATWRAKINEGQQKLLECW